MSKTTELLSLNVNTDTKKKGKLTYLSWAWAWARFLEVYPDATYEIILNSDNIPMFGSDKLGYVTYTTVTADSITRKMWLPVLDGANKVMKGEAYEYTTKYGNKTVEAISMFDINKTVMRCLVKNLAMFGLGLYIYSGEDLPELIEDEDEKQLEYELELTRVKIECKRLIEACGQDFESKKDLFGFKFDFASVEQLQKLERTMIKKLSDIEKEKEAKDVK